MTRQNREFDYCRVCKLSQNQGKGHKYSLKHKNNLSQLLLRFRNKIQDVNFFLKNPSLLLPDFKDRNRFWCVICEQDVTESDSMFVCENAIKHLVSAEHKACVNSFWSENGGQAEKRNSYFISDQDLAKWEEKCMKLKGTGAQVDGNCLQDSNNIHNNSLVIRNKIENFKVKAATNILSDTVHPLQQTMVEACQVNCHVIDGSVYSERSFAEISHSPISTVKGITPNGRNCHNLKKPFIGATNGIHKNTFSEDYMTAVHGRSSASNSDRNFPQDKGNKEFKSLTIGSDVQQLTCISTVPSPLSGMELNVHSGAPPPWLLTSQVTEEINSKEVSTSQTQKFTKSQERISKKLKNPKRVGAAWAEKRRAELERELKGESSDNNLKYDALWLPNFGRVWQSGSRKDSRKEFASETKSNQSSSTKTAETDKVQPYVSKRMRLQSSEVAE